MKPKPNKFASVEEILSFAMAEEQKAAHYYEDVANRMADKKMKLFLLELAEMEVEHYNHLKAKLAECRASGFCTQGIMSSFHES
ncbi:MAG: hypothetical protein ISR82_03485 [Candidatus Marinimicrobia bacterium]|nr:hypothetical protein [Candidatus Neomarinimicrobiota bacterium]MBL7010266.1 hypothetical protein [Candidatus Neomarinimicrobiota bacterium]MBL7030212.1 hypothetical protein [Candidatus Neomarinimicrobiota bacterium]